MPNITAPSLTFPSKSFPVSQQGAPTGVVGELSLSQILPRYSNLVKSGKVFYTSVIITAPVIFSTAAQNGPVFWNKLGSGFDMHVLALSVGSPTTAWTNTLAGSIGIATNTQTTAPTLGGTAAAITAVNAYAGGGTSQLAQIASGSSGNAVTVIVLPAPIFFPIVPVSAGAITTQVLSGPGFVDVGGAVVVNPGFVGYVSTSATLTSGVLTLSVLWAELPN